MNNGAREYNMNAERPSRSQPQGCTASSVEVDGAAITSASECAAVASIRSATQRATAECAAIEAGTGASLSAEQGQQQLSGAFGWSSLGEWDATCDERESFRARQIICSED